MVSTVLNDIFHFIEEQQIQHHPAVRLSQHNLDHKLNASATIPEPDIQRREFVAPVDVKENGPVDNYTLSEQLQQVPESESLVDKSSVRESNDSLLHTVNTVQEHVPPVEEPFGEPQKHTYASVLRVAKGQSAPSVAPQVSVSKNPLPASDWDHAPQHTAQQPVLSSNVVEMSGADIVDEISPIEYEGEIKSVYVRNLPSTVSESEIEEEFKKFGEISPDGVVICSRKDVGVCYAFVEFEDMSSVRNAVMILYTNLVKSYSTYRLEPHRLLDDKCTLKSGDQTVISHLEEEGWVEAEAAIQQKLQGVVLALEVMAGEVPTMEVNETTVDREETVFTAKHLDKIEAYLASKYIKLDKVHRAGIFYLL
ncbi:hypothetical protein Gohar_027071 [Gossypium harknessii]|uniref:RRM domain-containing protein n=1 Tax=Gossypium harknessii TaxID=34285 RepID=A0A7J9HTI6_9ROSI|nr:hypothetical protein [Gossypium harknessii]